jgi:AraC-like DNA-binding protein
MEPAKDRPFRGEAFVRSLPELSIGLVSTTANRITRTRTLIQDRNDDVILGIMLKGRAEIYQEKFGEVVVDQGDAVVWSNETPGHSFYDEPIDFLSIAIPRSALLPHLLHPDKAAPAVIRGDNRILRLLALYVQSMQKMNMPASVQSIASMHVRDLVGTLLGPKSDAAARRGVFDARLRAIKIDIATNLTSPNLTISAIAARHHLSDRSIRTLFNYENTTFSDFVLGERLALTHRRLSDPDFAGYTISAIAVESGFGDISYFNNAFRRRYDCKPSDVRAMARASQ